MALLPDPVDYTSKDFDALRARLIALVQCVFPDWTDFEVAGFENVLIEMYAFVGEGRFSFASSDPSRPPVKRGAVGLPGQGIPRLR